MRGSSPRTSVHSPALPRGFIDASMPADDDRFIGRSCYAFNRLLPSAFDDTRCTHCRFYLTAQCPHIDEFLDDVEEMGPD